MKDSSTKVIHEDIKDLGKQVDGIEKAVNEFKDIPPSDVKKINDLIIEVGTLKDQVKHLRDEQEKYKEVLSKAVTDAVKDEIAPLLKTMEKIEKKGKVTINETHHVWFKWPWSKKEVSNK